MRKLFTILASCLCTLIYAQQNAPINFHGQKKKTPLSIDSLKNLYDKLVSFKLIEKSDVSFKQFSDSINLQTSANNSDSSHFTLFGIGNVSDETLKNLNAGGKAAISFCPNPLANKWQSIFFASFNKNASNTDSLISTVLVFPEAGSHSALFTLSFRNYKEPMLTLERYSGPFLEFAFKKIKAEKDTTEPKLQEIAFNTLHYTVGYKWGFSKEKMIDKKKYTAGFDFALFLSYVNIPDEDHKNFEIISNLTATKNDFWALGGKVTFELNGFQIFADVRHVFGSEQKLPLKDLKGFNSNIGVAFNTDILRF